MNRIVTAIVATPAAVAVAAMAYAVATAGPASAATPVHAPHIVAPSSVPVLHAPISEFCAKPGTFALLEGKGWPVPLKCIRDAGGRGVWSEQAAREQDDDVPLPSWFRWVGGTHDKCITVWGQPAHKAGNTSARVCQSGWAGLS